MSIVDEIKFDSNGLVPVVTQDYRTLEVLMLAYMNKEALTKTLETKKVHYFSRSRKELWLKGETSGHFQFVKEIFYDCDKDAILIKIEQVGVACHTGKKSCFYTNFDGTETKESLNENILVELYETIIGRKEKPVEGSYTNYLFDKGIDKILKKVGEESAEVIIASKNSDGSELIYEASDLLYHLSVLLAEKNITWNEIFAELSKRR